MNIRWNSFFKINKVPNTLKHRRYGNFADNFFLSFAGFFGYTSDIFAAKPRRFQFSDSHTREHQYQNGIVALVMRIFLAKIDELFFFVFGKRAPLFDFIRIVQKFRQCFPRKIEIFQNGNRKAAPALQKLLEKCGRNVARRTTEHGLYQARFRRNGYNVEVADKNFSALKEKFPQKLIAADNKKRQSDFPLFKDYAEDWLSVKRRVMKDSTYDGYALQLRRKLIPEFGDLPLNKVQRSAVQNYLFSFSDAGKHRTAHKLKTLLSAIFATAAEDFPALLNPMRKIVSERYSTKKGKALTVQEERKIIEFCSARQGKTKFTDKACGAICVCARPLSYCIAKTIFRQ